MLLSIEVAVEYWLSLTWSPQAQWLCDSTHDSPLRDEVNQCLLICLTQHAFGVLCGSLYIGTCQGRCFHLKFADCSILYTTLIGCAPSAGNTGFDSPLSGNHIAA